LSDPAQVYEGGCMCGAVRYRFQMRPLAVSHCPCAMCRRATGAPFITWMTITPETFRWTKGEPAEFRSTAEVRRGFCGNCGTTLSFASDAHPEELDIAAATLDEPALVAPDDHLWIGSKLPWIELDDDLPRLERGHWGVGYPQRDD
jgi:hypothetical protein